MHAGSPAARWFHLSLAHLGPRLIATGQVTDGQLQQALRNFEDPRWSAYSPIIMAAWGQKP